MLVGENAVAGQYVPSKATPSGALTPEEQGKRRVIVGEDTGVGQYIEDMTQTFGGMSEGLEAAQKDSSIDTQPIFSLGLGEQKNGQEEFLNLAGDDRVAVQLMSDIKNTMTNLGQMTQEEQIGFISSEEGKEYLGKLGQLETRIGPLAFETFKNELVGNNALNQNNGNGANDTPIFSMNHYTAQQLLENASMSTNNGVEKILNPTKDDNTYVTKEDYNDLLKTKTEERDSCVSSMDYHYDKIFLDNDNSQYHQEQYNKYLDMSVELEGEIAMLNKNRELSKKADDYKVTYEKEEDAAVAFADTAVKDTGNDHNERVAVIINREVPVINEDGKIVMEKRYVLGPTLVGEHDNVIKQLALTYTEYAPEMLTSGTTISFVHTHPYCTGHSPNSFSGEKGKTVGSIVGEVASIIWEGRDFSDFGHYLGDVQVPWLPGVERMYLASPDQKKLYACDANGPIMDPNSPNDYMILDTYNAQITGSKYKCN